jgi:hypothetical protein
MKISRERSDNNLNFPETPIRYSEYTSDDITEDINNIQSSKPPYSFCEINETYSDYQEPNLEKFYEEKQSRMEEMLQKRSSSAKKMNTTRNNPIQPIKRSHSFVEEGSVTHRSNVKSYREFKDEGNFKIKITRNNIQDNSKQNKTAYNPSSFRKDNKMEKKQTPAKPNTTKNIDRISLFRDIVICNIEDSNQHNIIMEESQTISPAIDYNYNIVNEMKTNMSKNLSARKLTIESDNSKIMKSDLSKHSLYKLLN